MKNLKKVQTRIVSLEVTGNAHLNVNVVDEKLGIRASYLLKHTLHSLRRSKQRGISNLIIALVVECGKCFYKQGLQFYVMGEKNLPNWVSDSSQKNAKNTVVVLSEGDEIITCYRGTNVIKHLNTKQKYLSAA